MLSGVRPGWAKIKAYQENAEAPRQGLARIEEYNRSGGAGLCPEITPSPRAPMLERARELNISLFLLRKHSARPGGRRAIAITPAATGMIQTVFHWEV